VTGTLPFEGDTPVATALMQVNDEPVPPRRVCVHRFRPRSKRSSCARCARTLRTATLRHPRCARTCDASLAGEGAAGGAYAGAAGETSVLPAVDQAGSATGPEVRPVPERRTSPWVWVAIAALVLLLGAGERGHSATSTPASWSVDHGMTQPEAEAALAEAGLTLGETATENSDTVAANLVISQDPAAGEKVEKGAAVNIVLSLGIAQVPIPDVAEMTEAEAIAALRAAGLEYDRTDDENNAEIEKGIVIRTDPLLERRCPRARVSFSSSRRARSR